MNKEYQSTGNHELVRLAQSMGFHIHGLAIIKGREMVCKKTDKGEYFWWPIENEGSGFLKLFKGFSSAETTSKVYEDEIQVRHESENSGSITSLKACSHGVNIWKDGWDISLCAACKENKQRELSEH